MELVSSVITSDYMLSATRCVIKKGLKKTFEQICRENRCVGRIIENNGAQTEMLNGIKTAVRVLKVEVRPMTVKEIDDTVALEAQEAKQAAEAKVIQEKRDVEDSLRAAASAPPPRR